MNSVIINQIVLPPGTPEQIAAAIALRKLGLSPSQATAAVCRRSVDARKAGRIKMVYSVKVTPVADVGDILSRLVDQKNIRLYKDEAAPLVQRGDRQLKSRPVVVGFGPAGMFAALLLARNGLRPLVIERGPNIEDRATAVEHFWRTGTLDTEANVQFGEGGAGAFSDGKLVTRIGDHRCKFILETFAASGAPQDILIDAKPHVGTDLLKVIVKSVRDEIISLGGEIMFKTRLDGIDGTHTVSKIATSSGDIPCEAMILAIGHSARDTTVMLHDFGLEFEKKPFSIGFRIEHTQSEVNRMFYGGMADNPALPPAEYQMSHRMGERACYTFCMCPGGVVVPAASEQGGIVTNGMSYSGRAGLFANSAVVASVLPSDIEGGALSAIDFQRAIEKKAFADGFAAPCGSAKNYAKTNVHHLTKAQPTYAAGVRECDLSGLLPSFSENMIKTGLVRFESLYPGFSGGILTGVETRTSSPVRMVRTDMRASRLMGIYPAGEGAGYAGGIMSAAADGLRAAEALLGMYGSVCEN